MVYDATHSAQHAEADTTNSPGYCLQQTREWCGIASLYGDASTAWRNTNQRHPGDRHPPRGAPVYWTGGSHGYGHIALSLGNGKIRSTDAAGSGHIATVDLGWVETHWGLPYAGWAKDINEVTIPGIGEKENEMDANDKITNWSPDDGSQGELTVGQTLNQARGYAEDGYDRVKKLQTKVDNLTKTVNAIAKKVGA